MLYQCLLMPLRRQDSGGRG
ncbi:hypothetical protein YPPY66_2538, partial [Yersinia pestis PY-66]